jgi:hypothetical protein
MSEPLRKFDPDLPTALVLTLPEVTLLRNYFMKAGYITYEIDGLHETIGKLIRHADDHQLARRLNTAT